MSNTVRRESMEETARAFNLFAELALEERSMLARKLASGAAKVHGTYAYHDPFIGRLAWVTTHEGCMTRMVWQEISRLEMEVARWNDDWRTWADSWL